MVGYGEGLANSWQLLCSSSLLRDLEHWGRWCHHGSLPCDTQSCTTPAAAAAAMTLAEKHLCALKDAKIEARAKQLVISMQVGAGRDAWF